MTSIYLSMLKGFIWNHKKGNTIKTQNETYTERRVHSKQYGVALTEHRNLNLRAKANESKKIKKFVQYLSQHQNTIHLSNRIITATWIYGSRKRKFKTWKAAYHGWYWRTTNWAYLAIHRTPLELHRWKRRTTEWKPCIRSKLEKKYFKGSLS